MAGRPLKPGIDYFPLDVGFFQDAKIKRITKAQGYKSISVLICLLSNIYRKDGYFLKWNEDMPCLIADELGSGASEGVVTEVLSKALSVDFFAAGIFDEYRVLTSAGIQLRYFTAIERRKRVEIVKEYFLLNPADLKKNVVWKNAITAPFFNKTEQISINVDNNSINVDINTQSKVKKSKVKESRAEETATAISPAVLDAYQNNIRPICSSIELEKLADDIERYGEAITIKAIERAAIRGKRSLGYIEGILRRWEESGYDDEKKPPTAENPQIAMAKAALEMLGGTNGQ